jgi:hypothetical protein
VEPGLEQLRQERTVPQEQHTLEGKAPTPERHMMVPLEHTPLLERHSLV